MSFRFRKSINLGAGFRINLGKNGIGISWGKKGLRFSKNIIGKHTKDGVKATVSVPKTGIYKTGKLKDLKKDEK